jgi:nucleoside-diphosphate-sugar epimerase
MTLSVIGSRSELGCCFRGSATRRRVHVNIAGQEANTLLSDGHAWKGFERIAMAGVRRALRSDARFLVQASFAFVVGDPQQDPLRTHTEVILECERLVLASTRPACIVRLGYLYGPESRDLQLYRNAFRLGRPYWSGPRDALQYHLHQHDAVAALLAAAQPRNAGKILYATDGRPVSFMQFMDEFAHQIGRSHPLHIPALAAPLMRVIIRKEHMQQAALAMPAKAPKPNVPGWRPRHPDYRKGLAETIASW